MNTPLSITAKLPAWLFYFYSVDDMLAALNTEAGAERVMSMLSFTSTDRTKGENPYTLIGEAEITVTFRSRDQLVTSQLEALQASLAAERAESHKRQNAILDRISKLQALTYEVEA